LAKIHSTFVDVPEVGAMAAPPTGAFPEFVEANPQNAGKSDNNQIKIR
jgi:hypothetical protein